MRIIVCILMVLPLHLTAQTDLTKVKIDENIIVKIPTSWTMLTETEIRDKSIAQTPPLAMYGDVNRMADFSITKSETTWRQLDMGILKDFYKANLMNLYTKVDFQKDEITTVNKKSYISFEFDSHLKDDGEFSIRGETSISKYTYLRYHIENGFLYVFTFNAPAKTKNQYTAMAEEIMNSIVIK